MNLGITKEQYIALRQAGVSQDQILAKYQKQSPGETITKAANAVTDFVGARGIADSFATGMAANQTDDVNALDNINDNAPTKAQAVGSAIQTSSLLAPVGGIASGITNIARLAGIKTGASAFGKIAAGALTGYAFDVGSNLQNKQTPGTPGIGTAIGTAVPAISVAANVLGRAASSIAPKLLSYTSDVPEKAFETMLSRREPVRAAIQAGTTGEAALKNTQSAVRGLRKTISNEWQEGVAAITKTFSGQRMQLTPQIDKRLFDIADTFGIDLPEEAFTGTLSAPETINILKKINELPRLLLTMSPKGATVRQFKQDLMQSAVSTFGGETGQFATLYKNYAAKKGVFDAANDIVKAYSTGKPIQQSTALGRLTALFSENKSAYMDAILDLEKATGRDLLSSITAAQFQSKLPKATSMVTSSGTLRQSKSALDKAIDLLILPLSSPRSAAFLARTMQKISSPSLRAPGDILLQ